MKSMIGILVAMLALAAHGAEFHVAINGNDSNAGTPAAPLRTIQRAADLAQPGDVVIVHAGVYRERVDPPRGGTSDANRITYEAVPGEKVVITGSEPVKGWARVTNDVWKVNIPNAFFGSFNPYADLIHGDWFDPRGRQHHTGAVYLNGDWLTEAAKLDNLLNPAASAPRTGDYLLNVAWLRPAGGSMRTAADHFADKHGMNTAPCSEGGRCLGWIEDGDWVRYDGVDFGTRTERVEIRAASVTGGGNIELRLDKPDGELLGTCSVADTGDWQSWASFDAKIKPTGGVKNLCLVFRSNQKTTSLWFGQVDKDNTTIWAQFAGVNPNEQHVEINVRQTVFTPSKTGVSYLTVRGFDLRAAATPWAPPTAKQIGIISAYWCKGWIIESNHISYSTCCGVALGKYGDAFDNTSADTAEGYVGTLTRALTNGWNQATVGSHIVRNNVISHCEQTGVVGSLGCSFSTVTGNVIHDIHVRRLFSGAEMGGIKFHGAIDVTISHNHIYHCGCFGVWLDWMGQGAHVTGNLFHDNQQPDIFCEMQHGPILIANNLLLSRQSFLFNAQGIAVAHNLIAGTVTNIRGDTRSTPFQEAHSTAVAGMYPAANGDSGDHRFNNNLIVAPCKLTAIDDSVLPCFAAGNVFTKGTQPSKFDTAALLEPDFDPGVKLTRKPDGWYLIISEAKAWQSEAKCALVTTDVLGKAKVSGCAFENADGSPLKIDTDYFGHKREAGHPFPGPFGQPFNGDETLKVW